MTVEELIETLQTLPPTAMVFVDLYDGDDTALVVAATYEFGYVTLELE